MTLPSHPWHDKTEAEKVEWLAVFIGWTVHKSGKTPKFLTEGIAKGRWIEEWDFSPLEDWNHWRQVEEKVMEGQESLSGEWYEKMGRPTFFIYLQIDLPTRAKALYLAFQSIHAK